MSDRSYRPALILIALCFSGASAPCSQAQPSSAAVIQVGKNVQVSLDNPQTPHYEVLSCANPLDDRQMLAGVMTVRQLKRGIVLYRSSDGGEHWSQVLKIEQYSGDPTCTFGPDGTAYFAALLVGDTPTGKFILYRSSDGGATWDQPLEQPVSDRPYLITDETQGQFRGSLYVFGVKAMRSLESRGTVPSGADPGFMTGPVLFVSHNKGVSFTSQTRVALSPAYAIGPSNPVILNDGSVIGLVDVDRDHSTPFNMDRRPAGRLVAIRSTPDGTALREAVSVADAFWDIAKNDGARVSALAVDRTNGPFSGRLYAVWPDNRSGRSQVLLSWSDTKGDSWSQPIVVDDDLLPTDPNRTPDSINVSVAVNNAGVVGVAWGDRREHADNLGWRYRFTASLDGGDTFTQSVKVSSETNSYNKSLQYPIQGSIPYRSGGSGQPLQIRTTVTRFFYSSGDTVSMTVDSAGRFHPMWCDNRTGVSQLWTAAISVAGAAMKNGDTELSNFDDVTNRIEATVDDIRYDPVGEKGEFIIRIRNISPVLITGPIKMRLLNLSSQMGTPNFLTTSASQSAKIFTLATADLAAGEFSKPMTFDFSLDSRRYPTPGHDFIPAQIQFLNLRVKVFALGK